MKYLLGFLIAYGAGAVYRDIKKVLYDMKKRN